jgi:phage FluMu gp28-like protein
MRFCPTSCGIGRQLAEEARDKFGSRVEGVDFTNSNKEALAVGLKDILEDYGMLIPIDTDVSRSLHSVQKSRTSTGLSRFDAERSDATGHADYFWAGALAVHAGEQPTASLSADAVTSRGRREADDLLDKF